MQRIDVVRALAPLTTPHDLCVSSIGGLWDDWWNLRPEGVDNTFTPGILGSHASTGLGLALALPHRRIFVLETDGSMLMNTGILCTLGDQLPANLTIIVFDNGLYENIGGPPTHTSRRTDLAKMAEGAGCINCATVRDIEQFQVQATRMLTDNEFGFLVAKIQPGTHPWPWEQRKPTGGVEDKFRFIRYVEKLEGITIHATTPQN